MPNEGRCTACRFWDPSGPGDPDAWGDCRLAASDAVGEPCQSTSMATATAVGHTGVLATAPSFGCVQWQAQDGS